MSRVILLTDEPVLARGFISILSGVSGFDDASVCQNFAELLTSAQTSEPEVALVDLTPGIDFGILTQLRREVPKCRVVLWVRSISTELAYQAMEMGVRGILRKNLQPELLIKCLTKVAEGELWFDKALTASFLSAKMVSLTRRESQLVSLLSQGLKNKEIATTLSIFEGTVKVYLSRLFQKVGVKDRFELALYGLRNIQNISPGSGSTERQADPAAPVSPVKMMWLRSLVLERGEPAKEPMPYWGSR